MCAMLRQRSTSSPSDGLGSNLGIRVTGSPVPWSLPGTSSQSSLPPVSSSSLSLAVDVSDRASQPP